MKAIKQYFGVVLLIMVHTLKSLKEILLYHHSNGSYCVVLSCDWISLSLFCTILFANSFTKNIGTLENGRKNTANNIQTQGPEIQWVEVPCSSICLFMCAYVFVCPFIHLFVHSFTCFSHRTVLTLLVTFHHMFQIIRMEEVITQFIKKLLRFVTQDIHHSKTQQAN